MASFTFDKGKQGLLTGLIKWVAGDAAGDIRVIWCTAANNAEAVRATAEFVSAVTLAEFTGTGYPGPSAAGGAFATRITLAGEAANIDTTDHAIECDATDYTQAAVSAGTNPVTGLLIYEQGTSDSDSRVIAYMDISVATGNGKQFNGTGGDIALIWDAEGLIKFDDVT